MVEFGNLSKAKVPRSLLDRATGEIGDYTVSLVVGKTLVGSGTLLELCGSCGILTAHHVSRLLLDTQRKDFAVVIARHLHLFIIPTQCTDHLVVGEWRAGREEQLGPDLAFIKILDPNAVATIRSKKSFFKLAKEKLSHFHELPYKQMQWFVAGAPAEMA